MIKKSTSIILITAAAVTFLIALVSLDYSTISLGDFASSLILIAGILSPYGFALIINKMLSKKSTILIHHIISTFISVTGVFTIIYAQFIQQDAQSSMALIVIPLFQWIILIPLSLVLFILHKYSKK